VRAARKILSDSEHVYFVAEGAERFADEHGIELCRNEDLIIPREVERLREYQAQGESHASHLFTPELTVREALKRARASGVRTWLVADHRGVAGVVNLTRLEQGMESANRKLGDIVSDSALPHVHSDHGLDLALERMGANHVDLLPVVSRADVHKLLGVVTLPDVLASFGVRQPDSA